MGLYHTEFDVSTTVEAESVADAHSLSVDLGAHLRKAAADFLQSRARNAFCFKIAKVRAVKRTVVDTAETKKSNGPKF